MANFKHIFETLLFGLFTILYVASALPNMSLVYKICNDIKFGQDSAIGWNIVSVLNDDVTYTSSNGYNYYNRSPGETDIAYGHGACNGQISAADCNECMTDASRRLFTGCPRNTGAQVQLHDCRLRYEIYPFTE